jgi:hypothetical protein
VRAIAARSEPCHGDFLGDIVAVDCLGEQMLGSPLVRRGREAQVRRLAVCSHGTIEISAHGPFTMIVGAP